MNFQPLVPLSGYSGWLFLSRTIDAQQVAFESSSPIRRATDYFRENIANIETAEQLVNDRDLLAVALGAFGLEGDINNKFFIQKILEGGTFDESSLANRLADNRYAELSESFGFGDFPTPLSTSSFVAESLISRFERKSFEAAVGEQDNQLRLALNIESALQDITSSVNSNDAQWFSLLGNAPLREVVQTALGLPSQIASVDIDQQLQTFKDRAQSVFGTDEVSEFSAPDVQETITRLFLVRGANGGAADFSSQGIALALLRS